MSTPKLILAELRCRPLSFLLCVAAVAVAAALLVAGPTVLEGYGRDVRVELAKLQADAERLQEEADSLRSDSEAMQEETNELLTEMDDKTRRIMRDLGVNLRIVHRDTNMSDLYTSFTAVDFPEEFVQRLAEAESIETIVHVVAILQERIKWNGRSAFLVGTMPVMTQAQASESKGHMLKPVEPGTVLVGHELGVGLKEGDVIEISGRPLTIAKILPEYGRLEDVQFVVDLKDAQEALGKPDRINQILALGCKCKGDRISVIRQELEGVLPDTKITEDRNLATGREQQRDLVAEKRGEAMKLVEANLARARDNYQRARETYEQQSERRERQSRMLASILAVSASASVVVSALFVALMTWLNVRERRAEIGLLRALGKRTVEIAVLLLGKAAIIGLFGGAIGGAIGLAAAFGLGNSLGIADGALSADRGLLALTILGAPLLAAMAAYLPTLFAVTEDPATVLSE